VSAKDKKKIENLKLEVDI